MAAAAAQTTITVQGKIDLNAPLDGRLQRADAIVRIDQARGTFAVTGNVTALYNAGANPHQIRVIESDGNDDVYTVHGPAVFNATDNLTVFTVDEDIAENAIKGSITFADGMAITNLQRGHDVIKLKGDASAYFSALFANGTTFQLKEVGAAAATTFTLAAAAEYIAPRNLVLDFSAVNEPLKFTFEGDTLIVERVHATLAQNAHALRRHRPDYLCALIHDKEYSTLVVNHINEHTTILAGRAENTFAVDAGATFGGTLKGGVALRAGATRRSTRCSSLDWPHVTVSNTLDLSGFGLGTFANVNLGNLRGGPR